MIRSNSNSSSDSNDSDNTIFSCLSINSDESTINNQVSFHDSKCWFPDSKVYKVPKLNLSKVSNKSIDSIVLLDDEEDQPIHIPPPITVGKVVKVKTGNMIVISAQLPIRDTTKYNFLVRLKGIKVPNIRSKNSNESELGKISKSALHNLVCGKTVVLKNTRAEKYGVLVADMYLHGLNINHWMIDYNYAHECEF